MAAKMILRTAVLVIAAAMSLSVLVSRIERECVVWHAPEMSCEQWGGYYSR